MLHVVIVSSLTLLIYNFFQVKRALLFVCIPDEIKVPLFVFLFLSLLSRNKITSDCFCDFSLRFGKIVLQNSFTVAVLTNS